MSIERETRRESYDAVIGKVGKRHELIMQLLDRSPMTAEEIAESLFMQGVTQFYDRNFVSPRLTELKSMGLVETIGKKKCRRFGRNISVWAIKGCS